MLPGSQAVAGCDRCFQKASLALRREPIEVGEHESGSRQPSWKTRAVKGGWSSAGTVGPTGDRWGQRLRPFGDKDSRSSLSRRCGKGREREWASRNPRCGDGGASPGAWQRLCTWTTAAKRSHEQLEGRWVRVAAHVGR